MHGRTLLGGLETNGIEWREVVGLVLADLHELHKEFAIVPKICEGKNGIELEDRRSLPELATLGVDIELDLRAPDALGIRDAAEVLDDPCGGQSGRKGLGDGLIAGRTEVERARVPLPRCLWGCQCSVDPQDALELLLGVFLLARILLLQLVELTFFRFRAGRQR